MPRVRGRRRRFVRQHVALTVLAGLSMVFFLAGVVAGYVTWRLGQVDRLELADELSAPSAEPVSAADVIGAPSVAESEPEETFESIEVFRPDRPAENYLLVGSDSVEGLDPDDDILYLREEESGNHLADTVLVLRLRPDGTAAVLSIPRDLLVDISGAGFVHKINAAYNLSDPEERAERLINTVEENLDIELQHFVEINLAGFQQLIDAVGGVEVCFSRATRDRTTFDSGSASAGGTGFEADAGVHRLDGTQALQYVRSRRLLVQDDDGVFRRDGFWSDLERNERQQQFLADAIDQSFSAAVSSPTSLRKILDIMASHLTTSDTLSVFDDGLDLGRLFRDFDSGKLERYTFDVRDGERAGIVGLLLARTDTNDRILDVFRGIGWDDIVPARVTVDIVGAAARDLADALGAEGFVTRVGRGAAVASPRIVYGPGAERAAALVSSVLPAGVELVGDPLADAGTVTVHVDAAVTVTGEYRVVALPPAVVAPGDDASVATTTPPVAVDEPDTAAVDDPCAGWAADSAAGS